MSAAVYIIAVLCMLWSAVRLLRVFAGIRAIERFGLKAEVIRNMHGGQELPAGVDGISVVVLGLPDSDGLERLLGLDFDNYEVVIMAPLSSPQGVGMLRRYSMIRVNVPASAEMPCSEVSRLMRSRQRRYRRLVAADTCSLPGRALNCALALVRFGRILVIDGSTRLHRQALRLLDAEFDACASGMVCAVSAPRIDPSRFGCDTAVDIMAGDNSRCITAFDRDYAVSVGGFIDRDDCQLRMLEAMRAVPGLKHRFIPLPLATAPESDYSFRVSGSKIAVYLLLCLLTTALMVCVLWLRRDLIVLLLWCAGMLYMTMVAAGIMSMAAVRRRLRDSSLTKMLLEPFIYPFYPNRGSILEKNFFNS